jgi:precorrin-6B methylase 2
MSVCPAERVGQLLEAAWTASAAARVLAGGIDQVLPEDDPAVPLLAAAGLIEPTEGGYALVGREALRGSEAIALAGIRSALGQAYDIATGRTGWSAYDDDVLVAQGEASAAGGRGLAGMIAAFPGLADAFADGGVLLDVGVGVAALACAFCEAVPGSRVIGLDVEPRAVALAEARVRERGLADRVDVRTVGIEAFDEEAVADLAHMSPVFIPPSVLPEAMKRIRAALRPGGWLALSGVVREGADDATRWMAHNAGGSAVTDVDVAALATAAGFAEPIAPPLPPGAPRVLVCRTA